jgi:predicted alpha/beta-fold hydrolase
MPADFRPLPFLGNPHVQTVLAAVLTGPALRFPVRQRSVRLTDGDQLLLHDSVPAAWRPGERITLLVHGLGGSHDSGYMRRMARRLLPRGVRVVRMDLRGCGAGMALARRPYHGGCSDDVRAAAEELVRESPTSPLVLVGFSLGGNIVMKLAGEAATRPLPQLERVAAVSPPIDLERCAALLARPHNRFYELHYVRDLLRQLRRRRLLHADEPTVAFPRRMTMRLFDDLYTAPLWGFADAVDYYRRASALPGMGQVGVPALLLTARDDPFIAVESFERLKATGRRDVRILARGGHLGFLGRNSTGGIRWAEQQVADWVLGGG